MNSQLNIVDQNLNLGEEGTQKMNLKVDQKIEEQKLKNISTQKIVVNSMNSTENQKSTQQVKGIYQGVKIEDTALTINAESTSEVKKAMQKISKNEVTHYSSALAKIKKYSSLSPTRVRRNAKQVNPRIEKLTTQEKKTIKKYYEQFLYLSQKRDPLEAQLKTIDSHAQFDFLKSSGEECKVCQKVVNTMSQINWEGEELSLFNKNRKPWRKTDRPSTEQQVTDTWGSQWNRTHPYNVFYKEESKFKEAVKKIVNARKKYYDTINSASWRLCGVTIHMLGAPCGYQRKGSMEQNIQDASAEIELHIGSRLLEWMQQLGSH